MEKLSLKVYVDGVVVLTDEFCPSLPMSLGSEPFPNSKLPAFSVFKGLQTLWVNGFIFCVTGTRFNVQYLQLRQLHNFYTIVHLNNCFAYCSSISPSSAVYVGEHPSPESTNHMRAEMEVRNHDNGKSDFEARQVIVVTWHEVSPLSALFFGLPFYVSLHHWNFLTCAGKS